MKQQSSEASHGARIRRLARNQYLAARKSRSNGLWYISDMQNRLLTSEGGLDDGEVLEWLRSSQGGHDMNEVKKDVQAEPTFKLRLYKPDEPEFRPITWQRTIDMFGTIELDPDATWEQAHEVLADGHYYLNGDDGLIYLYDDFGLIAVIYPHEREEYDDKSVGLCNDDGFVLDEEVIG